MTAVTSHGDNRTVVKRLSNGYWQATITLPWTIGQGDYVQTESHFHDEQEARDWAEIQINYLTTPFGAES